MKPIEFWLSVGSTYSYLSLMRLARVEAGTGVRFELRPFSVRAIMVEMDNIPFATKPVKARYMWRDIQRRAAGFGIPASLPAPYPLEGFDLANRVAIVGRQEGWCRDYLLATYRRWFQHGAPAGSEPNLSDTLREIGQDPERVIAQSDAPETEAAYAAATGEARAKGIFGAPSFIVGDELFWGDDRMEDAVRWSLAGPSV
ncbi:2-hydroxychromene-2-carboxylate isomerase [Acidimangrovimonas pyrenivorans]|uniref:2-hydroxychromene-2-carboxylate isomerase n=1 Tax=Acidimangrovimonas pyrenivorans TaxID=2030798 RepID=A0ABV7ACA3_9RHOB